MTVAYKIVSKPLPLPLSSLFFWRLEIGRGDVVHAAARGRGWVLLCGLSYRRSPRSLRYSTPVTCKRCLARLATDAQRGRK